MGYGELMTSRLTDLAELGADARKSMQNTAAANPSFFYVLQDQLKVMFVDDDPILREFATVHLGAENTSIEVFEDGSEALAQLEALSPDVILLDLEMPKMDGFEFLQHLRANPLYAATPVIVCTGREDVRAIDRAFQAGATSFVVKPINWRLISYQIRYVVRAGQVESARSEGPAAAVMRVVRESLSFLSLAVERHPDLRAQAEPCAQALKSAVQSEMAASGPA